MDSQDLLKYFKKVYQNRTSSFLSGWMIVCADMISLFLCIGLAFFIVNCFDPSSINFRSFIFYMAFLPMMIIVYYVAGLYPGIMISPAVEIRKLTLCSAGCFLAICGSIALQGKKDIFDFTYTLVKDSTNHSIVYAFTIAIPLTAIGMPSMREIARHFFGHFSWWGVPAVIYCTGDSGDEIIERLITRKHLGYKPALIINSKCKENSTYKDKIPIFPNSKDILEKIKFLNIKVAIICDYLGDIKTISNSYRYTIFVSREQSLSASIQLRDFGGILGFSTTHNLTKRFNLAVKRLIDLLVVIVTLPLTLPIMILLAFLVKITSPGPIFYGHKRIGKKGKEIKCWKFRSMFKNSSEMLEEILRTDEVRRKEWEKDRKFLNDPRVTKFGKFLRKTSLDELPQLINIFLGEMSFVGPRPVTSEELEKYAENKELILSVTPGLSGMWQISGRSDTGYEERVNLDTFYIQNWSVWLDLWIMIKTVWVVLSSKGAY